MNLNFLKTLTSSQIELLKWVAIVSMVIDHMSVIILHIEEMRYIGRLAMPIFGYLLVYNYIFNTKNKLRYIKRIALLALISQPIYMWVGIAEYVYILNMLFTFAIGLYLIYLYEYRFKDFRLEDSTFMILIGFLFILVGSFLSYIHLGVLYLFATYFLLKKTSSLSFVIFMIFLALTNFYTITYSLYALSSVFIILLIYKTNIHVPRSPKYFFYLFYPLHMLCLYAFTLFG